MPAPGRGKPFPRGTACRTFPTLLFDALAATAKPPRTIAIVTDKFPSVHFMSVGAPEVAQKRGLREVLYLEFEFGTRDFGPIAARITTAPTITATTSRT